MQKTLFMPDLNCESCEGVLRKIASRNGVQVMAADYKEKTAILEGTEESFTKTVEALKAAGYESSMERMPTQPGALGLFAEFATAAIARRKGFEAEADAFIVAAYAFVLLAAATLALNYAGLFRLEGPQFYYAGLSAFATAMLAGISWQVQAYRGNFSHMNGMMVGMTIGMSAGFLAGAIVGATNGMFIGSVFGMAAGMLLGAYLGYCCGVMGALEGMMGGLMAGTMGAMLSVMMVFDNLDAFLAILFACFTAINAGLSYMVRKENRGERAGSPGRLPFLAFSLLAHTAILFTMTQLPAGIRVI
ncbi:MAG: heavy-metal-associated domain-containing protein [Candidatus Micrarchaeota archaeon]